MSINRNGRSRYNLTSVASMLLIMCLLFAGCGVDDWAYELPNGYYVMQMGPNDVIFRKGLDGPFSNIYLSKHIIEFCYNQSYVGLKRIPMDNTAYKRGISTEDYDAAIIEYYLIDTINDIQYGPYEVQEYQDTINNLGVSEMSEWIRTDSRPDGSFL